MVGTHRAEVFVFFKGELTLTEYVYHPFSFSFSFSTFPFSVLWFLMLSGMYSLKDMTASAAKMEETTAMLDAVLNDYLAKVTGIEVPLGGELTGVKIDMWNGVLQLS
jgi:hypothetical protein